MHLAFNWFGLDFEIGHHEYLRLYKAGMPIATNNKAIGYPDTRLTDEKISDL